MAPYSFWYAKIKKPELWRQARDAMYPPPIRRTDVFVAGTACNFFAENIQGKEFAFYIGVVGRFFTFLAHLIPILLHFIVTHLRGQPTAFDVNDAILELFRGMGPTYVKLGQWIASRPDVFPAPLCKKLSSLFDSAPPHPWEATEAALRRGDILRHLSSIEKEPLNSGSVAQVHRATLRDEDAPAPHTSDAEFSGKPVVIKVLHPGIRETMLTDLVVIKWFIAAANWIPGVQFFSLDQNFDEFASLLLSQLDLEREADNLLQFLHNFRYSNHVVFPMPHVNISNKEVLVESYEIGAPLHQVPPNHTLARIGCKMFMQMLFRDNFTHADLHPGNIMVRYRRKSDGVFFAQIPDDTTKLDSINDVRKRRMAEHGEAVRKSRVGGDVEDRHLLTREDRLALGTQRAEKLYDPQLVILDPGLITSLSEKERNNFLALFTAVACGDGDLGAKLMLERSPGHQCTNVEKFKKDMREIFDAVGPQTTSGFSLSKIDIGGTLTKIFQTMREHRVRIDGNFASLVATVLVGEGLGRKMHPDYNIFAEATPWLMRELKGHELEHLVVELQRVYGAREIMSMGLEGVMGGRGGD